jgi:hypothetical protein
MERLQDNWREAVGRSRNWNRNQDKESR